MANFAAPSTIKSDLQTCILKMMGLMINGSQASSSAGLLLMPVFAYKPGGLFTEEFTVLKQLSNAGGCNVGVAYQLLFDPKTKTES